MKRTRSLDNLNDRKIYKASKIINLCDELICTICQSQLNLPCTLNCGHSFCFECMKKFHKTKHPDYVFVKKVPVVPVVVINEEIDSSDSDSGDIDSENSGENDNVDNVVNVDKNVVNVDKNVVNGDKNVDNTNAIGIEADGIEADGIEAFNDAIVNVNNSIKDVTSDIIRGNLTRVEWVNCENCDIECPNCKCISHPFPKLNILLHNIIFQTFPVEYTLNIQGLSVNIVYQNIIKLYEKTFRFRNLYEMLVETVKNCEIKGISFQELVTIFSDYKSIEVMWALYRYHELDDFSTFIILNDRIIFIDDIRDYIEMHINTETSQNLLVLIAWICGDEDIFDLIDERCGVPSGEILGKFKNEESMLEIFKQFINSCLIDSCSFL